MIPTEPTWRSYIVETIEPIFTPRQCQMVIDKGMSLKKEIAQVGMGRRRATSGVDTKKESRPSVGFLLKICLRCIVILKRLCLKQIIIILVLRECD